MRIWDINPGYLNRQSLLGEHRELHGIVSIIHNNKKGYSRHPETIRWIGYGWALRQRHRLLAAEMHLRGYSDKSPVSTRSGKDKWPEQYIDEPYRQFKILKQKYQNKEKGRIPLPRNAQQLWSQHKYSVLARDVSLYKKLGRDIAKYKPRDDYSDLAAQLTGILRIPPSIGGIRNAIQHMWGYVSQVNSDSSETIKVHQTKLIYPGHINNLLQEIQNRAIASNNRYLLGSTALSELQVWLTVR